MKWVVATFNVSAVTRTLRTVRSVSRQFALLSTASLLLLFATGLIGLAQNKGSNSSISSMKSAVATLSVAFFLDMLAMEMPHLQKEITTSTFSPTNTATFLIRSLTGVHPLDPASLLASEIPGLRSEASALLYSGTATQNADSPADFTPPADAIPTQIGPSGNTGPSDPPPAASVTPPPAHPATEAAQAPQVFIYHSHNRESFLPELKSKGITKPDLAYDPDINITLVGKRLKEQVEAKGIRVIQETTDYPSTVKSFQYAKSYAYSAQTVKTALAQNENIGMIFDIHRDSLAREKTTVKLGGKDYAQVYFVVGKKNPGWEKNSEFAGKLNAMLEEKMPGISRGVYGKGSNGNGEYNQSLSPSSILMEIGGPYNSLEEMYRTADVIADIIAELQKDAVKASAPAGSAKGKGGSLG
ncbi:stage II sporulation protein P [Paenibacillus sp. GYB004]|uniref:stage II sporulation protein P n=1 Tax=Paenibacillus sp. GYB004 TaxID=2994393 RepID=UPI002F964A8D